MIQIHHPQTVDSLVEQKTARIEQAVRDTMPRSKFRLCTVSTEQRNRTQILLSQPDALHPDWNSLDTERRSAACRLEWARLTIFLKVYVLPALLASSDDVFHVIVADRRWQVSPDELSLHAFERPRRKLRHGMQRLRSNDFDPVFIAVYELSAARNLDGSYRFEPHIHLLVFGAKRTDLKQAFYVRQHRSERGKMKPVRIEELERSEVGNILGYISKITPQERVQYMDRSGRYNRTTNRMSADRLPLWLSCMSKIPITQLIQFGGFAESMTYRFATCEMATLIGEL